MTRVQPESISGFPSWATSLRLESNDVKPLWIYGSYRGVDIFVEVNRRPTFSSEDIAAGRKLCTDEVAKLEAA